MPVSSTEQNHLLDLRFQVYLEEYKNLQSMLKWYDEAISSNTNFTLTAVAAVIALSTIINVKDLAILFFVVPAIFYALCWAHLRFVLHQNIIVAYLHNILIPQIRRYALGTLEASDIAHAHLLYWEKYRSQTLRNKAKVWNYPILGPLFSLQLGTSVILVLIPVSMRLQGHYELKTPDYILLLVNAIAVIYTAVQGWIRFREVMGLAID